MVTIWLISISDQYRLRERIAYVKDEGSNLITMITILKSTIKCEVLGLNESFEGTCFGHVFFKTCQFVTTNEKFCKKFQFIFIKYM